LNAKTVDKVLLKESELKSKIRSILLIRFLIIRLSIPNNHPIITRIGKNLCF